MGSIAIENLKDQCRNGDDYNCKDKAKKILLHIVKRATDEQVISTVDESLVSTLEEKRMNVRGTKSEWVKGRGVHPEIFRPKARVCLAQVCPRSGPGLARSGEVWLRSLRYKK